MTTYTSPTYVSGKKGLVEAVLSSLAALYRRRWLAVYWSQREITRRHRGFGLDVLWALLSPLLQVLLLTLIFSKVIGLKSFKEVTGDSALNFGLYLYCGLNPYLAFTDALTRSINSIRSNTALVQKVVLPLEIFPLSAAITTLVDALFGVAALVLVVVVVVQRLEWTLLLLPLIIVVQLLFTLGLCYLFAAIGTYMPDIRNTLRVVTRGLFFLTPIVWTPDKLPTNLRFLVDYNPLAFLVDAYRGLILEGTLPDPSWALWFSVFAGALFVIGFVTFVRVKQSFVDVL